MVVPTPGEAPCLEQGHGLSHPRRRPGSTGDCSPISLNLSWVELDQVVQIIKQLFREKESDFNAGDESTHLRYGILGSVPCFGSGQTGIEPQVRPVP